MSHSVTGQISVNESTNRKVGPEVPIYTKRHWLIWNVSVDASGAGVAIHFWSDSLDFIKKSEQFNESDIPSDIAALTLTLSVNRP